jgi:single-stranded DNA-binding protein
MSQLYCTGRVTSELELKTSAKKVPYLNFPIVEYVGYGRNAHPQYLSVWAWGATARQLVEDGVGKGSVLWISGSLELEEYAKKDGVTRDKRLKLKLKDWGFVPSQQHQGRPGQDQSIPPQGTIDGEREDLPE